MTDLRVRRRVITAMQQHARLQKAKKAEREKRIKSILRRCC